MNYFNTYQQLIVKIRDCIPYFRKTLNKLWNKHTFFNTLFLFFILWFFKTIAINSHYLSPFTNSIQDYEITDIAYSYFKKDIEAYKNSEEIVLINIGQSPCDGRNVLSREKIAQIVKKLNEFQPKAIAIDVVFNETRDSIEDAFLKEVILETAQSTPIVLGLEIKTLKDTIKEDTTIIDTKDWMNLAKHNNISFGYINLITDKTRMVRYVCPKSEINDSTLYSFGMQTALAASNKELKQKIISKAVKRGKKKESINYHLEFTKKKRSFFDADYILDTLGVIKKLPDRLFKNKIFILGNGDTSTCSDIFFTPKNEKYTARFKPDTFGMEIHAEFTSMIKNDLYIRHLPTILKCILTFLFVFLNVGFIRWVLLEKKGNKTFEVLSRTYIFIIALIFLFLEMFFFLQFRLHLNLTWCIVAIIFIFDAIVFYDFIIQRYVTNKTKTS